MSHQHTAAPTTVSPWLPPRWFIRIAWKVHRGLYQLSGGRLGLRRPTGERYGLARLTVTGRRSGLDRSVMIGYFLDREDIVTMAMNGWGAPEPAWWLNLQAEPRASVTLGEATVEVTGHAAEGADRDRLWDRWRHFDTDLDGYASRRPTQTEVIVLRPTGSSP